MERIKRKRRDAKKIKEKLNLKKEMKKGKRKIMKKSVKEQNLCNWAREKESTQKILPLIRLHAIL